MAMWTALAVVLALYLAWLAVCACNKTLGRWHANRDRASSDEVDLTASFAISRVLDAYPGHIVADEVMETAARTSRTTDIYRFGPPDVLVDLDNGDEPLALYERRRIHRVLRSDPEFARSRKALAQEKRLARAETNKLRIVEQARQREQEQYEALLRSRTVHIRDVRPPTTDRRA